MLVNKAYKFRIYPTKEQETLIAKTIGCSRFVFNRFLGRWNDTYKETGKGLTYSSCSAELTKLKKELVWLQGINLLDAKNYQKQKRKVARLHERVMNQRDDFLNKLSTEIIKNHDIICIEDLNTKGMLRNHKLAKSISDVSWSAFVTKLEYKAKWYGKTIVKISRWFPSSQVCSECGHQDGRKPLEIRDWTCPVCHEHHDRDINASKNILAEGLRTLALA